MSEQDDGSVSEARRRRRWVMPVLTLTAIGAVLLLALVLNVAVRPASVAAGPRSATPTKRRLEHDLEPRPDRAVDVRRPLSDR